MGSICLGSTRHWNGEKKFAKLNNSSRGRAPPGRVDSTRSVETFRPLSRARARARINSCMTACRKSKNIFIPDGICTLSLPTETFGSTETKTEFLIEPHRRLRIPIIVFKMMHLSSRIRWPRDSLVSNWCGSWTGFVQGLLVEQPKLSRRRPLGPSTLWSRGNVSGWRRQICSLCYRTRPQWAHVLMTCPSPCNRSPRRKAVSRPWKPSWQCTLI